MTQKIFFSTKTYCHNIGLSACFRQWRADSHCRFLHGYALQIKLTFAAVEGLDERNWVVDFGGLKEVKQWLQDVFDHKLIIAADDPQRELLERLEDAGLAEIVVMENGVGCERFAEAVFDKVTEWLGMYTQYEKRVCLASVEVMEHGGNSAICAKAANLEELGD